MAKKEQPKKISIFESAKVVQKGASSKKEKPYVVVPKLEGKLLDYAQMKEDFDDLDAELKSLRDEIKLVAKRKFVELYQKQQSNPNTFLMRDGDGCIMVIPTDKYDKIDEERARTLIKEFGKDVIVKEETIIFNNEVLARNRNVIENLIMNSKAISDDDKMNLLINMVEYKVQKGTIDRLAKYKDITKVIDEVRPQISLKLCSEMENGGEMEVVDKDFIGNVYEGNYEEGGMTHDEIWDVYEILTNKNFEVSGSWYSPTKKLMEMDGVIDAEHLDTTSSAGDWSGYFVQKSGNKVYFIPFYQENIGNGYSVSTDNVYASWQYNKENYDETLKSVIDDYLSSFGDGGITYEDLWESKSVVESYLPIFNGFYGTIFEPDESSVIEEPYGIDDYDFDYDKYYEEVGKECCDAIESKLMELGFEIQINFQKVVSPKYYNYSNDSIDCEYILKQKQILDYLYANKKAFDKYIKNNYTSRDGFMSSYSNNADEWIEELVSEGKGLGHQLGSILQFILNNEGYTTNNLYEDVYYKVYLFGTLKEEAKEREELVNAYINEYVIDNYATKNREQALQEIIEYLDNNNKDYEYEEVKNKVYKEFENIDSNPEQLKLFKKGGISK